MTEPNPSPSVEELTEAIIDLVPAGSLPSPGANRRRNNARRLIRSLKAAVRRAVLIEAAKAVCWQCNRGLGHDMTSEHECRAKGIHSILAAE